jgi:hypothetical protein
MEAARKQNSNYEGIIDYTLGGAGFVGSNHNNVEKDHDEHTAEITNHPR